MNFSESSCLTLCACFFPKENTRLYPPLKEALVTQGFFLCIGISGSLRFYFVILSKAEGSSADWMRSLHCGRDDRVTTAGMAPELVILSEAEGSSANWMRSLHCGRDDRDCAVAMTGIVQSGWHPSLSS